MNQAEEIVIGHLINDMDSFWIHQADLSPDYFETEHCRIMFESLLAQVQKNPELKIFNGDKLIRDLEINDYKNATRTVKTVLVRMENNQDWIDDSIAKLKEDYFQRIAIPIVQIAHNELQFGNEDRTPRESVTEMISKLGELLSRATVTVTKHIKVATASVVEKIRKIQAGELVGDNLNAGFQYLNDLIGGYFKGELIVIAARAGLGKTTFMLNGGLSSAKCGVSVAIISIEMTEEAITQSLLAIESGVKYEKIRKSQLTDAEMKDLEVAQKTLDSLPIFINCDISTDKEIQAEIAKQVAVNKVELFLVDYLQLIETGPKDDAFTTVTKASQCLRKTAKKCHVAIMALSQLSRKVESRSDKRPTMADLRMSGQIEQDAATIGFLYRESYYDREGTETDHTELDIQKCRSGGLGKFFFSLVGKKMYERDPDNLQSKFNPDNYKPSIPQKEEELDDMPF